MHREFSEGEVPVDYYWDREITCDSRLNLFDFIMIYCHLRWRVLKTFSDAMKQKKGKAKCIGLSVIDWKPSAEEAVTEVTNAEAHPTAAERHCCLCTRHCWAFVPAVCPQHRVKMGMDLSGRPGKS